MIGQTIGNYRLLKVLGEGGMGVVYEAEHVAIGRRAAVKMMLAQNARDGVTIQRFFNEARATNEVRHPGIVQIYDSGTTPDGAPWLIMELLEGETLGARMARLGRLAPAEAVDLGAQAASVLAAAHAAGIVHRDLKPDNLFIVPDPGHVNGARVKVLDFGIAKLAARDPVNALRTQTGVLMGTPLYMSPEQCRGTKQVDFRSDIYSLGLIVYQMLAGAPPFVSEGLGELLHMHMNVPAAPLSEHNPAVSPALAGAVAKAVEKDPAARHASMRTFQEALLTAIDGGQPRAHRSGAAALGSGARPSSITAGSTTLSATAGEMQGDGADPDVVDIPRRRRGGLVAALVVALGVAGVFAVRALRPAGSDRSASPPGTVATTAAPAVPATSGPTGEPPPAERPAEPPPPPQPARTAIDIATTPAQARLLDAADGHLLGISPWHGELPSGPGELQVRIEKAGYKVQTISIPLDRATNRTVELEKARAGRRRGGDSAGERIIKL
jgi:serine/threonine-protein kinase